MDVFLAGAEYAELLLPMSDIAALVMRYSGRCALSDPSCLLGVLSHVSSARDLARACAVSRAWRDVGHTDHVWQRLYEEQYGCVSSLGPDEKLPRWGSGV